MFAIWLSICLWCSPQQEPLQWGCLIKNCLNLKTQHNSLIPNIGRIFLRMAKFSFSRLNFSLVGWIFLWLAEISFQLIYPNWQCGKIACTMHGLHLHRIQFPCIARRNICLCFSSKPREISIKQLLAYKTFINDLHIDRPNSSLKAKHFTIFRSLIINIFE